MLLVLRAKAGRLNATYPHAASKAAGVIHQLQAHQDVQAAGAAVAARATKDRECLE
jgi:hypothetical protein